TRPQVGQFIASHPPSPFGFASSLSPYDDLTHCSLCNRAHNSMTTHTYDFTLRHVSFRRFLNAGAHFGRCVGASIHESWQKSSLWRFATLTRAARRRRTTAWPYTHEGLPV